MRMRKPAHLAGGVPESLVTVVELDPEHAVPERLDDLAGHLDLVFFLSDGCLLSCLKGLSRRRAEPTRRLIATRVTVHVGGLRALVTLLGFVLDLGALGKRR